MAFPIYLSDAITGQFHLTPSQIKCCDRYFTRYWDARYVFSQLLACPRLVKDRISYQPIFLDGLTQDYLGLNPEQVVRLSFRRLATHKTGFVIISTIPTKVSES